jgi:hypothetical protein
VTSKVRISIALALAAIIVGVLLGVFLSGGDDDHVVAPDDKSNAESASESSAEPATAATADETSGDEIESAAATDEPKSATIAENTSADAASLENSAQVNESGKKGLTGTDVVAPSFDVVRVNRRGDAVIAGRAAPGAEVTVRDAGRDIGSVMADERGEWVLLPDEPLAPGDRELTIVVRLPSGDEIESDHSVVLSIPERGDETGETPLAVLVPRDGDGASRPLQVPTTEASVDESGVMADATSGSSTDEIVVEAGVGIDSVDYDEAGEMIISGRAEPGASLNIYVDDAYVGTAKPDADGRWTLRPGERLTPGTHTVRVDKVNSEGVVLARIETPLARVKPEELLIGEAKIVVQPGNSLWRIARRAYGGGIYFSVIYDANRANIRNPDLIYPGQVFSIPDLN